MNVFTVTAFAILSCSAAMILKKTSESIGILIGICAAVIITCSVIYAISPVITFINELDTDRKYSIYYTTMLKGLGVSLLTETASDICNDCGEVSIGNKIILAGKVSMILLSMPILEAIITLSKEMMSR